MPSLRFLRQAAVPPKYFGAAREPAPGVGAFREEGDIEWEILLPPHLGIDFEERARRHWWPWLVIGRHRSRD
jgi:hypothetical protein